MPDILINSTQPLNLGATGMDELMQNIGVIVTTLAYSVPLDRAFAGKGSYIDSPNPYEVAKRTAEVMQIIEEKEPRVKVNAITYEGSKDDIMDGRVYPRIHFELKEGVVL